MLESPKDLGYDYQPISAGDFRTYEVDSIDHNAFTLTVDTFHFYLKELVDSSFVDQTGEEAWKLFRFRKTNLDDQWSLSEVWHVKRNASTFQRVERNLRYTRLAFPVDLGASWNGHALTAEDARYYEYQSVDQPGDFANFSFDSVAEVLQISNINLIEEQIALEHYAKGVGLVYKQDTDLDLQTEGGYEVTWELIDFDVAE